MNARTSIALAIVAGFGFGALSIHTLHAQQKPPVYMIVETDVLNPDAYVKEYAPKAQALTRQFGGRVLAASLNVTTLEGQPPKRIAVLQWPSMQEVKAWHGSPEFRENRKLGDKLAKFRIYALEGLPQP